MTGMLDGLQWSWIIKAGVILFGCRRFLHVFRKSDPPLLLADLAFSILLTVACVIFLIHSHAPQGALELIAAFLLAYLMEDLFDRIWNRKRLRRNGREPDLSRP